MRPFRPITIERWRGLNEDENPSALSRGEFSKALNIARLGNLIGTRPGLEYETGGDYATALGGVATKQVQGAFDWSTRHDFQRDTLIVVGGNIGGTADIYTDDGTVLTKATNSVQVSPPTSTNDRPWTFAAWQDKVFAVGGLTGDSSADSFWYYDGSNDPGKITGINNLSGTQIAQPQFIFMKWGYIFIGGMNPAAANVDASNNKGVIRYHQIGNDPTLGTSWPAGNTIGAGIAPGSIGGLNDFGDEFLTGMAGFVDNAGDWLLAMTNRQMKAFARLPTGGFLEGDAVATGCVHQRAYVDLGVDAQDAIYMSSKGIHSLRQSQQYGGKEDKFLSWKIRTTFQNVNRSRIQFATGSYWEDEGLVLFTVSTGSNTYNDTLLCLDIKGQEEITAESAIWYEWQLASSLKATMTFVARDSNGKPRLYIGTTTGDVCRFNRDVYSDLGSGYVVEMVTADDDFGNPGMVKVVGDTYLQVQPTGNYTPTMQYRFDYGQRTTSGRQIKLLPSSGGVWGTDAWGSMKWGGTGAAATARRKFYGRGQGTTVAHRFAHAGVNEPFFLVSMTQEVAALGESAGDID